MPKYYSDGILDYHREATETATEEIETNLFIGGEFRKPESGEYFETRDPAIDEPIVEIARGKATDIDNAVIATKEAADEWVTPSFQNKIIFVIDSNFDMRLINENK